MDAISWGGLLRFGALAKEAGRQAGAHPMLTFVHALGIAVLAAVASGVAIPGWPSGSLGTVISGAIAIMTVAIPFFTIAIYKGKVGTKEAHTEGIVQDSPWMQKQRNPRWVLQLAKKSRRNDDLPDVTVIGTAAFNWTRLFAPERAAETMALLRSNRSIRIGIAIARREDEGLVILAGGTDGLRAVRDGVEAAQRDVRFWLDGSFMEFRDRIEIRLLRAAVPDSSCAYDPGRPYSPCVVQNVAMGWQGEPHPVLVVEDIGQQRDLYDALRERVALLWRLSEPVWPVCAPGQGEP